MATVPGRPGTEPVYRITGVRRSRLEESHQRMVRYLFSMAIRTACFLLAIVVHGPIRWVLIAAAVVLPYISVVFANAGRERADTPPPEIFLRPDRPEIEPPETRPDTAGR